VLFDGFMEIEKVDEPAQMERDEHAREKFSHKILRIESIF
jgi:hypothetical protein